METLIVIIIVALAAAYLIRTFIKGTAKSDGCACGGSCTNCPPSENCAEKKTEKI
jgi:hypothetical protein